METVVRTVASVRHGRCYGLAAAGSSCEPPRQAAQHFAAALPAVSRPAVEPDFRRSGIRASGFRLALAGATDRGARSARRACTDGGRRPEASHPVSPLPLPPVLTGQTAAGGPLVVTFRSPARPPARAPPARPGPSHGKRTPKHAQGEGWSKAKGSELAQASAESHPGAPPRRRLVQHERQRLAGPRESRLLMGRPGRSHFPT